MRAVTLSILIATIALGPVAAREACDFIKSNTQPGLYKLGRCSKSDCLLPYNIGKFSKGQELRLAHVFPMKSGYDSVAIVKIQKAGMETKQRDPVVHLKRDGLDFSCAKFGSSERTKSKKMRDGVFVSFKSYDDFHRYFINNRENRDKLEREFHTFYYNGHQCVRTDDVTRRALFLLNDDSAGYSPFLRFLAKLVTVNKAQAREDFEPEAAEVAIRAYSRSLNERGCINIRHKIDSDVSRLTVIDLESSVGENTLRGSDVYQRYQFAVD